MNEYKLSENAKEYWEIFFKDSSNTITKIDLIENEIKIIAKKLNDSIQNAYNDTHFHFDGIFFGNINIHPLYIPFLEEYFEEVFESHTKIDLNKNLIDFNSYHRIDMEATTYIKPDTPDYPPNSLWARMHYDPPASARLENRTPIENLEYFICYIDKEINQTTNKENVTCDLILPPTTEIMKQIIEHYKKQGWCRIKFDFERRKVTLISKEEYLKKVQKDIKTYNFTPISR